MMSTTAFGWIVAFLGVSASAVWIVYWLLAFFLVVRPRKVVQLADQPADPPAGGWPALAVIFAARNEAEGVERATRSMLTQDYPNLQVIAVDDRSTDGTGELLDRLAAEHPKLCVVHVRDLPAGWLGKNHALQKAAEATQASWILLTDGDVVFSPGTLRRGVAWAVTRNYEHVTVAPEVPADSVGERLFLAMFGLIFLLHAPPWGIANRNRKAHIGIGAFNLVRADAFRAVGGFERLALSVDEDMRLGLALKAAGYRTSLVLGKGALWVRWQVGLGGILRGLEKNFFAGLDFRLDKVVFGLFVMLWVGAAPHLGLFFGPWWTRAICALGVLAIVTLVSQTAWQSKIAWYYGLTLPLSALLCDLALLRSTWQTLRHGGIRWRDHHYGLGELKNHVRERNQWTREVWKSTR